jgi:hypothetical protein
MFSLRARLLNRRTPFSLHGWLTLTLQASQGASLQQQLGNLYTASLYSGLASLLAAEGARLAGQRILCFSFGSGVVASMFTLTCRGPCSAHTISPDGANGHQRSGGVHADSSMSNSGRAGTCAGHRNTGHQACGNLGAVATEQQQQQQPPCQQQPQQQPSWPSQPCSLGAMASQVCWVVWDLFGP